MPSVPRPRLLTVCAAGALVGAVLVGWCQGAVALSDRRQGWPPRSVRLDGHGEFGEHGGESVLLGCIGGDLILAAAHVLHERVPSGLSGRIQAAGRGRRFDRYAAGMPGPGSTSISDRSTAPWTAQVVSTATSPPHPRWR